MQTSPVRRMSLGLFGLVAAVVVLLPSCRESSVTVTFRKTETWDSGYDASMVVTNEGRSQVDNWTVEFDLPQDSRIATYWDAGISQYGRHVQARSLSYNAKVKRNRSVEFGFTVFG